MVTDGQVRLLRRKLMEGRTLKDAAALAEMSESTARRWQSGELRNRMGRCRSVWARPLPGARYGSAVSSST